MVFALFDKNSPIKSKILSKICGVGTSQAAAGIKSV